MGKFQSAGCCFFLLSSMWNVTAAQRMDVHLSYFHSLLAVASLLRTNDMAFVHLCPGLTVPQPNCIWGIWITFIIDSHLLAIKRRSVIAKLFLLLNNDKNVLPSNEFGICSVRFFPRQTVSKIHFHFICCNLSHLLFFHFFLDANN